VPTWSIRLLGHEELNRAGFGSVDIPDIWWPIFISLLGAPRYRLSRSKLAGRLWPDKSEKASRHCLATALWRITTRLPADQNLIAFDSTVVGLQTPGSVWVDLIAFERRAKTYMGELDRLAQPSGRARLRRALGHYRGPIMAERDLEWIAIERERLRSLYLDAMFALASAESAAESWPAARETAQRICAVEPLREDAQRLLMTAHVKCGARAMALDQYQTLVKILQAELGIQPMAQTQRLATEIAGHALVTPLMRPVPDRHQLLRDVRDHLNHSLELLNGFLDD